MLALMNITFISCSKLTKLQVNSKTSLYSYYNLTEASFEIFLSAIPKDSLPVIAPVGKKDFRNTSKCELIVCQMLSVYHRKYCKVVPFRYMYCYLFWILTFIF